MFGRNKRMPPPIPKYKMSESYVENHEKKHKDPIFNPFTLIIWVLMLASIGIMSVIMNMGMNMVITTGYVFLTMGAVCGGILFLMAIKTNAFTELKAFLYGKPILAVRRKDGQTERTLGDYGQGTVNNKKYGRYFISPESVSRDKKSGAAVINVIDSIGTALTEPFIKAISVLRNTFGFKDIDQIEAAKALWSKCTSCGFMGVPMLKVKLKEVETDKVKKTIREEHEQCFNCMELDCMERAEFPKLKLPLYESIDYSVMDEYFKYNQNPDRLNVIIKREVQNELEKEHGFPIRIFGILLGVGVMMLLISIGLLVLLPKLALWIGGEAIPAVAPAIIG